MQLPDYFLFQCNPDGLPFEAEKIKDGLYSITREGRFINNYRQSTITQKIKNGIWLPIKQEEK